MANKKKRDSSWKNIENYSKGKERLENAVLQHPDESGDNTSVYNFMKNNVNNKRKEFHILPFKQYEKMGKINEQEMMLTDSPMSSNTGILGQDFQTPGALPQDNMDIMSLASPGKKKKGKKEERKGPGKILTFNDYFKDNKK